MKRDALFALFAGFLIGLFAIPVVQNTDLIERIPSPYAVLLIVLPVLSFLGIVIAGLIGRKVPVILQVAKFGLVGVLNTAIDFGILNILIFATGFDKGLKLAILNSVAVVLAIINSYFWNKSWVFESKSSKSGAELVQFLIVSIAAVLISDAIVGVVTGYIAPLGRLSAEQWANIAKVFGSAFSMIWNFLGYKFVVFRKKAYAA